MTFAQYSFLTVIRQHYSLHPSVTVLKLKVLLLPNRSLNFKNGQTTLCLVAE